MAINHATYARERDEKGVRTLARRKLRNSTRRSFPFDSRLVRNSCVEDRSPSFAPLFPFSSPVRFWKRRQQRAKDISAPGTRGQLNQNSIWTTFELGDPHGRYEIFMARILYPLLFLGCGRTAFHKFRSAIFVRVVSSLDNLNFAVKKKSRSTPRSSTVDV